MSGKEVADHLSISVQYYYDLEKGKRNLSAAHAVSLAIFFNTSTDYLLGISDFETFAYQINLNEFQNVTRTIVGDYIYKLIIKKFQNEG